MALTSYPPLLSPLSRTTLPFTLWYARTDRELTARVQSGLTSLDDVACRVHLRLPALETRNRI